MGRFQSRKFLLAVATLLIASLLVWFAKIDGGSYSAVVIAVLGTYMTGDVAQKWVERGLPPSE